MSFAGGGGGGTLPYKTDGVESEGSIIKYRDENGNYVDRVQAFYTNTTTSEQQIEVAFAVPIGANVEFDLPMGSTETNRAPEAVIANIPDDGFDQQDILGRQTEFDFYSYDVTVPATEDTLDGQRDGRIQASVKIPSSKGTSKELGVWILGSFAGGSGTSSDPYIIEDWTHLDSVRDNLGSSFELDNDLDSNTNGYVSLASSSANSGNGWNPVGDDSNPFTGTFDGQGNVIQDLYIDRGGSQNQGVFGDVRSGGVVQNLIVRDCDITCEEGGAITDSIRGGALIERCTVSGVINHSGTGRSIGGIIAENFSDGSGGIRDCYSRCTINAGDANNAGGLVGIVGLSSFDLSGEVYDSYSQGTVNSESGSDVGGFTGELSSGTISDSYWDTQASGQSTGIGNGSSGGLTGLTTSEMQGGEATTNMSGFDFTGTWETVESEDSDASADGYPILQADDRQTQLEIQGIFQSTQLSGLYGTASIDVRAVTYYLSSMGNDVTAGNQVTDTTAELIIARVAASSTEYTMSFPSEWSQIIADAYPEDATQDSFWWRYEDVSSGQLTFGGIPTGTEYVIFASRMDNKAIPNKGETNTFSNDNGDNHAFGIHRVDGSSWATNDFKSGSVYKVSGLLFDGEEGEMPPEMYETTAP